MFFSLAVVILFVLFYIFVLFAVSFRKKRMQKLTCDLKKIRRFLRMELFLELWRSLPFRFFYFSPELHDLKAIQKVDRALKEGEDTAVPQLHSELGKELWTLYLRAYSNEHSYTFIDTRPPSSPQPPKKKERPSLSQILHLLLLLVVDILFIIDYDHTHDRYDRSRYSHDSGTALIIAVVLVPILVVIIIVKLFSFFRKRSSIDDSETVLQEQPRQKNHEPSLSVIIALFLLLVLAIFCIVHNPDSFFYPFVFVPILVISIIHEIRTFFSKKAIVEHTEEAPPPEQPQTPPSQQSWLCTCGRENPSYTYTCVCGESKRTHSE